jgi:hypothetical protein
VCHKWYNDAIRTYFSASWRFIVDEAVKQPILDVLRMEPSSRLWTLQERAENHLEYHRQYQRKRRASLSPEQREAHRQYCRDYYANLSPDELERQREKRRQWSARLTTEERRQYNQRWRANLTKEERKKWADHHRSWEANLPEERREIKREAMRKYRAMLTPEQRKKLRQQIYDWRQNETLSNLAYRIECYLRSALIRSLKQCKAKKAGSALKHIGCDTDWLIAWLESQFKPGMNWDNWGNGQGKWQVDHIRPCASFDLNDPEEQKLCFHWTNLQPLWAFENLSKGRKWSANL